MTRGDENGAFDIEPGPGGTWILSRQGERHVVLVARSREGTWVHCGGRAHLVRTAAPRGDAAAQGSLAAPMTGRIVDVLMKEGDAIAAGTPILVLSAMKMQVEVKSPIAGTLTRLPFAAGDQVEGGTILAVVEPTT